MAKVRPLGDRVVVKVIRRDERTAAGIILPDQVREQSDRGEVLAVGPGSYIEGMIDNGSGNALRPVAIQVGEVVLFSPYAGTKVVTDEGDFLLLREGDVLGIQEPSD
jgi:chaperonin GroES